MSGREPRGSDLAGNQIDSVANPKKLHRQALLRGRTGTVVAIYDGQHRVGDVIERDDGTGFDAFDVNGACLGTFATRIAAARAIPSTGDAS